MDVNSDHSPTMKHGLFLLLLTLFDYLGMGGASSNHNKRYRHKHTDTTMDSKNAFWMEAIKHQGSSPFNPNASDYQVFRNVKDFGAKGDGTTDDADAINRALSFGNRCGGGNCRSSTVTPAVVYFPAGTYLVSKSIIAYYYTQLIGDAKNPPTLLAAQSFNDLAVIDADPYIPNGGGSQWYTNQNNFFRSVRNFIIDVRRVPAEKSQGTGIHWQVAQATSLINIVFHMSTDHGTAHQGIWMENGSGGFMGDLVFNGGKYGIWAGNQQFTVRNVTMNNAEIAFFGVWNWGWTFQGIQINNCQVGFDLLTGGRNSSTQSVGSETILDAVVQDTPIFIRTSTASTGVVAGSLVIYNAKLYNSTVAVGTADGQVVLEGGTTTIRSWGQGSVYQGNDSAGRYMQGDLWAPALPGCLLDDAGNVVSRPQPQYEDHNVADFISVKDRGAKGDGVTDDSDAIQGILDECANDKIIFFDHGVYMVTRTITIPAGARLVGEAWSVIAGKGPGFQNVEKPQVVVRVGYEGSKGIVEITDLIFSTIGPALGAVVLEWNIKGPRPSTAGVPGMWNSHIVLGGRAGSGMESSDLPAGTPDSERSVAFLAMHITRESTGYFEGTWIWLADHDLDETGENQITVFSARGLLSQSQGPIWMIGTAEHHTLYQYNLVGAKNHYIGFAQTETPYYQPIPPAPLPFGTRKDYMDPHYPVGVNSSWALRVSASKNIHIFGAGFYSFFRNFSQDCIQTHSCQNDIVDIASDSEVYIYSLNTVGTRYQLSVDQKPVISFQENINGFADTVTFWRSGVSLEHAE